MLSYTDLYPQHSHKSSGAVGAADAAKPVVVRSIHELVGGTLSAQQYTERLAALEQRVGSFEEKLMNLTRLIKLSQGLQAEKDTDLRKENDELRGRLQRQEHLTAQLMREVANLKEQQEVRALDELVHSVADTVAATRAQASALEERVSRTDAAHKAACGEWYKELDETKVWARRNLQRVKEHMDVLAASVGDVRGSNGELSTRVERMDCKAEVEYKKLRVLLQQKATETDAMAALVEKELRNVRQVAQRHELLGTPEADPQLLKFQLAS